LIDAVFDFGAANAGKAFLIFVSGPNGTSRNLLSLPADAPEGCPLGNEQGVQVAFVCDGPPPASGGTSSGNTTSPSVLSCSLDRSASGSYSLNIIGARFRTGVTVTIDGLPPKKLKLKEPSSEPATFSKIVVKGKFCQRLPGVITVNNNDGSAAATFQCNERCQD
jgi:hypothetical protein